MKGLEKRDFYGLRENFDFPPRGKIYLKPFFCLVAIGSPYGRSLPLTGALLLEKEFASQERVSGPVLPFLAFWENGKENAKKPRISYPYRTPKIPGKEGKNARKNKKSLAVRGCANREVQTVN